MTVYVTQESQRVDYADAERYGEISFLTANEFRCVKNSLLNKVTIEEIARKLREFDTNNDYLLLSGDPVVIGLAMHCVLSKGGATRLLKWSAINRCYQELTLILKENG